LTYVDKNGTISLVYHTTTINKDKR